MKTLSHLLESSLETTSHHARELAAETGNTTLNDIALQLWNPLVRELIKTTVKYVKHNSAPPEQARGTLSKHVKKLTITKAMENLSLHESEKEGIMNSLKLHGTNSYNPYNNAYHRHLQCVNPTCEFCLALYSSVNITRCVGHRKCVPSGYFPHVGTSLWNMLKSKHKRRESFRNIGKPCKPGELPSLNVFFEITPSLPSEDTKENATIKRVEYDLEDWNDIAEEDDLAHSDNTKRKRRM